MRKNLITRTIIVIKYYYIDESKKINPIVVCLNQIELERANIGWAFVCAFT